jgi:hypothetical protein
MQHYPENDKEIKEEKRNLLEKVRPWIELATFFTAMGVIIVMVCNSFQTQESVNLTRISVNKLDTAFALTRDQNKLIKGQLDVMINEYNLSKSSFEVEKNKSVALVKDLLEKGKPKIVIHSTKADISDSGLTAYIDFINDGPADAENVEALIVSKREGFPKDSLIDTLTCPAISKNRPVNVSFFMPSYRGDFLIRAYAKYRWPTYDLVYEAKKFYRFFLNADSSAYRVSMMDDIEVKKRW